MKARQVAWLGAVPKGASVSRWEAIDARNKQIMNRQLEEDDGEQHHEAPREIDLPEIDAEFSHLWELFQFAGYSEQTGNGIVPLSWQELESFVGLNSLGLTLFEIRWLREMSEAYCKEYYAASDVQRTAPYATEKSEEDNQAVALEQAKSVRSMIRSKGRKT